MPKVVQGSSQHAVCWKRPTALRLGPDDSLLSGQRFTCHFSGVGDMVPFSVSAFALAVETSIWVIKYLFNEVQRVPLLFQRVRLDRPSWSRPTFSASHLRFISPTSQICRSFIPSRNMAQLKKNGQNEIQNRLVTQFTFSLYRALERRRR